jgi:preprotein translocase subunit SecE
VVGLLPIASCISNRDEVMVKETYEKAVQALRDVRSELRKVTFPSRKETLASTVVVLAAVGIISVYLGMVDLVLARVLHSILR